VDLIALRKYDVIVMAVGHQRFVDFGVLKFKEHLKEGGKFMDLKSVFETHQSDFRL
jgi:UDP-N-acetyl-D-mannosaminuronate dehydrogenase